MAIKGVIPYIFCNGNAAEAIQHYERALGAKAEGVMRYGDAPQAGASPANKDRIMHAQLNVGELKLYISDPPAEKPTPNQGNVWITLDWTDAREMTRAFEALSAGGNVTMSIQDTFWGATFGMLIDRFGIGWMFNCDKK
jgi:PhnB protein